MKIFNLVSNIVIIIAFILMWVLHPKGTNGGTAESNDSTAVGKHLPIAYVNIDSIIVNYQMAIDLNEELMKQQESARTELTAKARKLEGEMAQFQRKVENNGFLTMERAQSEQQRLIGEQQKLDEMQQRLANELGMKQQDLNDQVMESIVAYVTEYNKEAGYQMVYTQTAGIGTVLLAAPGYNITAPVLTALNEQYNKQ